GPRPFRRRPTKPLPSLFTRGRSAAGRTTPVTWSHACPDWNPWCRRLVTADQGGRDSRRALINKPLILPTLVMCLTNGGCYAARDFGLPLGASDEHTLPGSVRSKQRRGRPKELRPEGLRRKWPGGFVVPQSRIPADMLLRHASPQAILDA